MTEMLSLGRGGAAAGAARAAVELAIGLAGASWGR